MYILGERQCNKILYSFFWEEEERVHLVRKKLNLAGSVGVYLTLPVSFPEAGKPKA